MKVSEHPQGTAGWYEDRLGKLTASRISDAVAKTKTGWGASRANYMAELIAERLTGVAANSYTNAAMQWGIDHEDEAADAYGFITGYDLGRCAFTPHPTIAMSGATPDRGVALQPGLVEIKCPNTATHLATLLGAPIDKKYTDQMQWQMACATRDYCDWVSYDPRLPVAMRLHIARVSRDDAYIKSLEAMAIEFLAELEQDLKALIDKYGTP